MTAHVPTLTVAANSDSSPQTGRDTPCILVVDDDRLIVATLKLGLEKAGYRVLEATSGEAAMSLAESTPADLALLDIRMPGMSGIELAALLDEQFQIPAVFLSAYNEHDVVDTAVRQGALGYLVKPLDVGQVLPTVGAALERAGELRQLRAQEDRLQKAVMSNRTTGTAVGVIMERQRLNATEAFEVLRRTARSQRRKIADVAQEIIAAAELVNLR